MRCKAICRDFDREREFWQGTCNGATCHGESGIPNLLYPHTKFSSEYCTPVHDSLVDPVWGYNIRVVD